jgi:ZU5 domain
MLVRARTIIVALAVAGSAVACRSDSPTVTAPTASANFKKVKNSKTSDTSTVVTRKLSFATDVTVSAVIGSAGGTLELKDAGLTMIVPAGAVSSDQTFSITALAGNMIAYEFAPHMNFAKAVRFEQKLDVFNIPSDVGAFSLGYFAQRADLGVLESEVGTIQEQLPVVIDISGGKAKADVMHFSGYLMASGRSALQ